MASNDPGPLLYNMPIVDVRSGWPTQEFMRLWGAQRTVNVTVDGVTTDLTALQADVADIQAVDVIAGTALSGGGNIAGPADITINHDNSAVTPGTYGDATNVPQFTVDQQGHVTAVTEVPISGGGGQPWYFDPPAVADFGTTVSAGSPASTAAIDDADLGLVLQADVTSGTDVMYGIVQSAPAFPFTITAHIYGTFSTGSSTINPQTGLLLRASSDGTRTIFGFSTASDIRIRKATNTTFVANTAAGTPNQIGGPSGGIWMRIICAAANNIVYQVSFDGKNFVQWQSTTANVEVPNLDQIGLAVSRSGANTGVQSLVCDYWAVT